MELYKIYNTELEKFKLERTKAIEIEAKLKETLLEKLPNDPEIVAIRNELNKARAKVTEMEAKLTDKIETSEETLLEKLPNDPEIVAIRNELNKARAKVTEMEAKLTNKIETSEETLLEKLPNDPEIVAIRNELNKARAKVTEVEVKLKETLEDVENSKTKADQLTVAISGMKSAIANTIKATVEENKQQLLNKASDAISNRRFGNQESKSEYATYRDTVYQTFFEKHYELENAPFIAGKHSKIKYIVKSVFGAVLAVVMFATVIGAFVMVPLLVTEAYQRRFFNTETQAAVKKAGKDVAHSSSGVNSIANEVKIRYFAERENARNCAQETHNSHSGPSLGQAPAEVQ